MNSDFRTILFLLLAVFIVFGLVKKLFKLVLFVAIAAVLFYLYNVLM